MTVENIHKEKLKTELVTIVRSRCPFMHSIYNYDFEFNEICKKCEFLVENIAEQLSMEMYGTIPIIDRCCTWKEYETELVKQCSESDDDELYGEIPSSTYYKVINCYRCGERIVHTSGMSCMTHGDILKCKSCKLIHRYIGYKNSEKPFVSGKYIFAIPVDIEKVTNNEV